MSPPFNKLTNGDVKKCKSRFRLKILVEIHKS